MTSNSSSYYLLIFFTIISQSLSINSSYAEKAILQENIHSVCNNFETVNKWSGNNYLILVCSYGDIPHKVSQGIWKGNGLIFYKIFSSQGNRVKKIIKDHSENKSPLEYSFSSNTHTLTFTTYTYDPNHKAHVAFMTESLNVARNDLVFNYNLLLKGTLLKNNEVKKMLYILTIDKETFLNEVGSDFYKISDILYELRNHGIKNAKFIKNKLIKLKTKWWTKGSLGETLNDIIDELSIIDTISQEKN